MSDDSNVGSYLSRIKQIAPIVREHAAESERMAQLAPPVVEAFHEAGLFRMLLASSRGGGGLNYPEALRIAEEVASIDGSAGWNLAICMQGPLFGEYLSRDAYEEVFGDPRAIIAGSLNPTARAIPCDGGWKFSGSATYASGSAQATWIMASGLAIRDGKPEFRGEIPVIKAGLFPMKSCKILDTWSVSGMRGTGSNDCEFEDVFVPDGFTFESLDPQRRWQSESTSAVPLALLLGASLTAVALGVARHVIDAFVELAGAKVPATSRSLLRDRPLAQIQLAQAEGLLRAARAYFYESNDEIWRKGAGASKIDSDSRALARLASVTAVKLSAQAVDLIYDAAGISAIRTSCAIERCWRDIHAVTQHVILSTGRFEVIGRVLLGLDPGSPII
jgi:alkylation response protein AidB-like acyl-CoA dehydrogenase